MGPGPEPQPFHLSSAGTLTRCCVDITTCTTAQRPVLTLSRGCLVQLLKRLQSVFLLVWIFLVHACFRERASRCAMLAFQGSCPVGGWKSKRTALSGAHTYLLVRTHCLCKGSSDSCWDFPISCQYIHVSSEGNSNRRETCL